MLTFTHATMGAGKSAILIAKATSVLDHAIVLKPRMDSRDGLDKVSSRNGASLSCLLLDNPGDYTKTLIFLNKLVEEITWRTKRAVRFIFIDEAQFLTEEEVNALLTFSLESDIIIECYGLLTDFKTNLFEGSKRLIEVADNIEHLVSYSRDGNIAKHNARFIDGEMVTEGETVMLGKEEAYKALSNKEYFGGKINE